MARHPTGANQSLNPWIFLGFLSNLGFDTHAFALVASPLGLGPPSGWR